VVTAASSGTWSGGETSAQTRASPPNGTLPEVGTFYQDFRVELARWEKRYAGRPREELLKLAFLSLEREQLVTVTYHDDLLSKRLAALPLEAPTRELFRHALAFTWKDEEMHAVYVRGLLWREGSFTARLRANWHFLAGLLAGWATFVQQHVSWREAPLSRALSTATLWGGLLTGTAPPSVRQHLRYHSFRDFCAFNIDAEKTAALSWERLAVLGRQAGIEAGTVELFERIREDELQHEKLFALLADSLSADDRLKEGLGVDALAGRIGALHPGFLPWSRRTAEARHVLGSGGRVSVTEGGASREEALERALNEAGLWTLLEARAKALGKQIAELRVAVKTSFMLGVHRGDPSMIVAPESLSALVHALRAKGVTDVAVLEAPTGYDRFHQGRTVAEVARYFGFQGGYRLVDAASEQVPASYPRGMVPATISATWRDADVRLVLGKLRSHPVKGALLGLSTLEGLGMRPDAFHFAERPATPEIAMVTLAHEYPPHFSVLDAWSGLPDGLAGMLGAKRTLAPGRWYAGADALAVDLVAARHAGIPDPYTSRPLRTAIHWFGDPRQQLEVSGRDAPIPGWRRPFGGGFAHALAFLAAFVYAHASGRGALFVPSVDEQAFPPRSRPGPLLRLGKRVMRWFFKLPTLPSTGAS
jgi:uncharacterized protein (DUF362 family)